jgi:cytochrome c-type biogenesis protein
MDFGIGTYGIGYLAGVLSVLSPCVLPLVPIVLGTAVAAHRLGAIALTAGLVLSFTTVGIFIAAVGASAGLDSGIFRDAAALLLIAFGLILMSTTMQARFATATAGISHAGNTILGAMQLNGLLGQFLLGLLLGAVWSPCVGPTLGAAATLASQGKDLTQVALLMAVFGMGAGTPMLVLGALSRKMIVNLREKLLTAGKSGKYILGIVMIALGLVILFGLDKSLEALMMRVAPEWLLNLTTRF